MICHDLEGLLAFEKKNLEEVVKLYDGLSYEEKQEVQVDYAIKYGEFIKEDYCNNLCQYSKICKMLYK